MAEAGLDVAARSRHGFPAPGRHRPSAVLNWHRLSCVLAKDAGNEGNLEPLLAKAKDFTCFPDDLSKRTIHSITTTEYGKPIL